jgi:AP-3 complex subunit beta
MGQDSPVQASITKLQLLTLATKLIVLSPSTPQLIQLSQYLFMLARCDADFDVRDRSRFLHALLRGLRQTEEDEDEDTGGVVLRREQVKLVMLGLKGAVEDEAYHGE